MGLYLVYIPRRLRRNWSSDCKSPQKLPYYSNYVNSNVNAVCTTTSLFTTNRWRTKTTSKLYFVKRDILKFDRKITVVVVFRNIHIMLCYVMLCYVKICYVMLCYSYYLQKSSIPQSCTAILFLCSIFGCKIPHFSCTKSLPNISRNNFENIILVLIIGILRYWNQRKPKTNGSIFFQNYSDYCFFANYK